MALVAQPQNVFFEEEFEEINDCELIRARNIALETGSMMPIIKEELKCLIQSRRLSLGQDELEVTFTPQNNDERRFDPQKLYKRREQNRNAAKRFRERSKARHNILLMELEEEEERNRKLKMEIHNLTQMRNYLTQMLLKVLKDRK